MREKHCALAVLNAFGRCIAYCRFNIKEQYRRDCIGMESKDEGDALEMGKEYRVRGGEVSGP